MSSGGKGNDKFNNLMQSFQYPQQNNNNNNNNNASPSPLKTQKLNDSFYDAKKKQQQNKKLSQQQRNEDEDDEDEDEDADSEATLDYEAFAEEQQQIQDQDQEEEETGTNNTNKSNKKNNNSIISRNATTVMLERQSTSTSTKQKKKKNSNNNSTSSSSFSASAVSSSLFPRTGGASDFNQLGRSTKDLSNNNNNNNNDGDDDDGWIQAASRRKNSGDVATAAASAVGGGNVKNNNNNNQQVKQKPQPTENQQEQQQQQQQEAPSSEWSCSACTFLNPLLNKKCDICHTKRPAGKNSKKQQRQEELQKQNKMKEKRHLQRDFGNQDDDEDDELDEDDDDDDDDEVVVEKFSDRKRSPSKTRKTSFGAVLLSASKMDDSSKNNNNNEFIQIVDEDVDEDDDEDDDDDEELHLLLGTGNGNGNNSGGSGSSIKKRQSSSSNRTQHYENNNNNNSSSKKQEVEKEKQYSVPHQILPFPRGRIQSWRNRKVRTKSLEKLEDALLCRLALDDELYEDFQPFMSRRFEKKLEERIEVSELNPKHRNYEPLKLLEGIRPLSCVPIDDDGEKNENNNNFDSKKNQNQNQQQQQQHPAVLIDDDCTQAPAASPSHSAAAAGFSSFDQQQDRENEEELRKDDKHLQRFLVDPLAHSSSSGFDLRPYQVEAVNFLLRNFSRGISSLLALDMGLGKTACSCVFLNALRDRVQLTGPHLILAPLSTLSSWLRELQRWAPGLEVISYKGPAAFRASLQTRSSAKVFLCSTQTFVADRAFFHSVLFGVVIIDEAQCLKNDNTQITKSAAKLKACGRVGLTGTPVANAAAELWSIVLFLFPEMRKGLARPDNDDEEAALNAAVFLNHIMLRRTKGDILKDLLPKKIHPVIPMAPSRVQKLALTRIINRAPEVPLKMIRTFAWQVLKLNNHPLLFGVLAAKQTGLIGIGGSSSSSSSTSAVSDGAAVAAVAAADGGNRGRGVGGGPGGRGGVSSSVAQTLAKRSRGLQLVRDNGYKVTPGLEMLLASGADLTEREIITPSAKMIQMDTLLQIILSPSSSSSSKNNNNNNRKKNNCSSSSSSSSSATAAASHSPHLSTDHVTSRVLIFSRFTTQLDILEGYCVLRKYHYERLDGASLHAERELSMARFNHPQSRVQLFLITTTAGGVGVTLTGANHVIFFDTAANPQVDRQAADRAHRIGQLRQVHVHRLCVAGTIESKLLQRANAKAKMGDFVIDGVGELNNSEGGDDGEEQLKKEDYVINGAEEIKKMLADLLIEQKQEEEEEQMTQKKTPLSARRRNRKGNNHHQNKKLEQEEDEDEDEEEDEEQKEAAELAMAENLVKRVFEIVASGQEDEDDGNVLVGGGAGAGDDDSDNNNDNNNNNTRGGGGGAGRTLMISSVSGVTKKTAQATIEAQSICYGCDGKDRPTHLLHCCRCVKSYHRRSSCLAGLDVPDRTPMIAASWKCPRHQCFECGANEHKLVTFCCSTCSQSYCVDCLPPCYLDMSGGDGINLPYLSSEYEDMEKEGMVELRTMYYMKCQSCARRERILSGEVDEEEPEDDEDEDEDDED